MMDETRALKDQLEELDKSAAELDEEMRLSLARIPNLTRDEVPAGLSEADNVTVKSWGEKPNFDFTPKPHWELGESLGILDLERAAKLSGARFAVYMGAGARLERALIGFMLDMHTEKHGYTEVLPPFMVNSKSLFGTGQLPKFAEDLFRCSDADAEAVARGEFKDNDHWLIPTAEVPVTNLYRDEILDEARLAHFIDGVHAMFPCRSGSGGKRYARHHSPASVSKGGAGEVYAARGVRRRARKADAECRRDSGSAGAPLSPHAFVHRRYWFLRGQDLRSRSLAPGPAAVSGDLFLLQLRGVPGAAGQHSLQAGAGKGKTEFVHTLNGSGLAVGRTWLAILENYQQADGSVAIPDALRPYMGGLERITGAGQYEQRF